MNYNTGTTVTESAGASSLQLHRYREHEACDPKINILAQCE